MHVFDRFYHYSKVIRQFLHVRYTASESTCQMYIGQLMLIPIFCFVQDVKYTLTFLKPCVDDKKSVSFTTVNKHLTSLISPSQSMLSKNVSVRFICIHTIPVPRNNGVCLTLLSFSRTTSNVSYNHSTSSSSYSDVITYICTNKSIIAHAFNLTAMIFSLHTIFLIKLLTSPLCTIIVSRLAPHSPPE